VGHRQVSTRRSPSAWASGGGGHAAGWGYVMRWGIPVDFTDIFCSQAHLGLWYSIGYSP
jgi:hypothetical protein